MFNLVDLSGKRIIVTGASSGIGKAVCLLLSKLGATVILLARSERRMQETVNQMEGNGHKFYVIDLTQTIEIESFVKEIVKENGAVDGLVYSAGIGDSRPLKMIKPDKLLETFSVNTLSFIEMVRVLSKTGVCNAGMSIVGISSVSSVQGNKSKVSYCASKGAMDAAVRAMAKELAAKTIRVNTINPGYIKTELYEKLEQGASGNSDDFRSIISRQYLGLGNPEDVANLAAFLLSDAARFITGTSIMIDGGRTSS